MKTILKPLYVKVLLFLLFLYTLSGFLIIPYLIQSNFSKTVQEKLNTYGSLGRVYINPFSFEIELDNLLIKDDTNNTLLYFKKLDLNYELTQLFQKEITLNHLIIENLKTSIIIYKNNRFNFTHILDQLAQQSKPEVTEKKVKKEQSNLYFTLDSFILQNARIVFQDNTKSKSFEVHSKPFNFSLQNFSTKPNTIATLQTDITLEDTLNLKLKTDLTLSPMSLDGSFAITDIMFQKIHSYLADDLAFTFDGNTKILSSNFQISQKDTQTNATLSDLILNIPTFVFDDKKFHLKTTELNHTIKKIKITKDEQLDFTIDTIDLSNQNIELIDLLKNKNHSFSFENLALNIDKFSSVKKNTSKISLLLNTPSSGLLDIKVDAIQEPLSIDGTANIKNLTIVPYQEYIKDFVNLDIKNTLIDSNTKLHITNTTQKIKGDVRISKIDLNHATTKQKLLELNTIDLKGINYTNNNLVIDKIILDKFSTKFKIAKDKTTNIDNLVKKSKTDTKEPKKESKSSFNYYVKSLELKNGKAEFSDHSLPLNFDTNIHDLTARIDDISSKNDEATVKLKGVVEKYGLARIEAKTILSNFKNKTDVSVNFENLDVRSFSPYSGKFIGQKIADGRLWLTLNYNIENAQLSSTNNIKLKNLTLGEDVNSTEAMSLPVGLAIALLEDSDGLIDVDVPVSGDMDNPQFELSGVIWKTVGNIITNIVTAPFRFLGSLLGIDSDELGEVEFRFGYAKILPPQKEKLDKLIGVLNKKKNLIITLEPAFDNANDTKVLQEITFNQLLKSNDKTKALQELYIKKFTQEKYDLVVSKTKKEQLNEFLSNEIKNAIVITQIQLEALATKRVQNLKEYFVAHKLTLDRIQIKNEVKDENTKDDVFSLQLELNIKDK